MSSRPRKDRGPPSGSEEQQLWQSVTSYLKSMEKLGQSSSQDLSALELKRKRYLSDAKIDSVMVTDGDREELSSLYRALDKRYEEEQRDIVKALEKLEVLIAVRDYSQNDTMTKRKKRRADTGISGTSSTSPPLILTPASERHSSPLGIWEDASKTSTSLLVPTPEREKKRSNSKSNVAAASTPALQRRGTIINGSSAVTSATSVPSNSSSNSSTSAVIKDVNKDTSAVSSSYIDPARARREVLAHQLPLQKGRKVAFRQPSKNKVGPGAANVSNMTSRSASSANAASTSTGPSSSSQATAVVVTATPDDEGETWIMATIIECINNDRNRYVVQDAEDTAMPTYNTTLKAIVPLPESLQTLPPEDYKIGTQVMGLYPDTSCFYQAIVRGGGPGMNGRVTAKVNYFSSLGFDKDSMLNVPYQMQRKADELLQTYYKLEFEDDGGSIQNVPASLVVERP